MDDQRIHASRLLFLVVRSKVVHQSSMSSCKTWSEVDDSCGGWWLMVAGDLEKLKVRGRGLMMLLSFIMLCFVHDFFEIWVFQKFFTSFAVRPGSLPAISDHLRPVYIYIFSSINIHKTCTNTNEQYIYIYIIYYNYMKLNNWSCLFPNNLWSLRMRSTSSLVKWPLLRFGFR